VDGLTERQAQVLEFITAWIDQRGVAPSFREIGEHLDIRSTNGVSDHVRALERKGYLQRVGDPGSARSLRVTPSTRDRIDNERIVGIPVLGRVAAGQPILAEEEREHSILVDRGLLPSSGELFALTVRGDSMIEDGILDGDFVFVRRAETCRDGEIAAVLIDGEATIKRFFRERGRIRLEPANREMEPIYVSPDVGEVRVMGVVVGVYRRVH
jgi:repressor LexA